MLPESVVLVILALIGWASGAYINYLADVLPRRRKFVKPFCLACETDQPAANFFLWPRRCRHCGKARSWRVWAVEGTMIAVAIWLWSRSPNLNSFVSGYVLLGYFALVAVIDLEHRLILHPVSITGAVLGVLIGTWAHGLTRTLLGGLAGFALMLGLYAFGILFSRFLSRLRGSAITEEALGFGDVNLGGVLGLVLGWPGIGLGLILAILASGLVSLMYILFTLATRRYRAFTAIPYGPFLIAGAIFLLFFGNIFAP